MSNEKKNKLTGMESWDHLREEKQAPKGPAKPWDGNVKKAAEDYLGFLRDPDQKKQLQQFIMETYRAFEEDKINSMRETFRYEREVDERGASERHKPGNITPILSETLNMNHSETAFVRGLDQTKKSIERTLDDRVDEINRMLAGIGGFSAQLKCTFARSTVVFLQQDDPQHSYREKLIFSINLPNYELKGYWDNTKPAASDPAPEPKSKKRPGSRKVKKVEAPPEFQDPRSPLQLTWDNAVNALAKIIEYAGLKPKYCKNDKHYGRFVMKQDLRSTSTMPDEYFSLTLDYNSTEKLKDMSLAYNKVVKKYNKRVRSLERKLAWYGKNARSARFLRIKNEHSELVQERDFFVGSTPDPNQMDEGLLFLIEVSTLKDYGIVKDRMQNIMTQYILLLSQIAAKDAEGDADLNYHLNRAEQNMGEGSELQSKAGWISPQQIAEAPEYEIDETVLKKRAA